MVEIKAHRRLILMLSVILLITAVPAVAAVYKYKKDGVWYFTDDLTAVPEDQRSAVDSTKNAQRDALATDLKMRLTEALKPANTIENATLATVLVKSTLGSGTGFFISPDGYILTNKHVIRPMDEVSSGRKIAATARRKALDGFAEKIEQRQRQLQTWHTDLENYRKYLDDQPDSESRRYNQSRYQAALTRYETMADELRSARRQLSSQRGAFEADMAQQRMDESVAALNQNFTIHLADNTPLYAYVVEISDDLDLALLKLDGYATPHLVPQPSQTLVQGATVYAIGNPVKLRNSVAAGIVSGFEGDYIKTDAQIYPGNSGGPLINGSGNVVGITTFKRITHKFEGLGFAITIDAALNALDSI